MSNSLYKTKMRKQPVEIHEEQLQKVTTDEYSIGDVLVFCVVAPMCESILILLLSRIA